jgi:diguanylate cyclase (GGDEF)-like protein
MPTAVAVLLGLATVSLVAYSAWLLLGSDDYLPLRDDWAYCALFVVPIVLFAARARICDPTKMAWQIFTLAATLWLIAEVAGIVTSAISPAGAVWAQALFLLVSPLMYAALLVLVRQVLPGAARETYLDGLIITLAVAAFFTLIEPRILHSESVAAPDLILAVAYPFLDLLQVTLILAAIAVMRTAAGLAWWLFLVGSVLFWVGDSYWLFWLARGEEQSAAVVYMLWPVGITLLAAGAWTPLRRRIPGVDYGWAVPVLVTASAFALMFYATLRPVPLATILLATGALLTGAVRSIGAFRDASARNQAQLLAQTDDLTGLTNRRGLNSLAGNDVRGQRALLLVDIDRFKQINDTLGHQAGDDVLQQVAARFQQVAPADVLLSRIGGDEFALFLPPGSGYVEAMDLARALHDSVTEPLAATGIELQVELSIGIALAPAHGQTLSALLLSADRAMYRAKREHISTQVFDPRQAGSDVGDVLVLQELRRGLDRDEFVCHFQPQLDVLTNEVEAVEALVRWQHPQRGVVPAGQFLPMVEQTTLIRPLTDTILDKSLAQLRVWDGLGLSLRMSVNISATNLMDRALPLRVAQLLAEHHIAAERLTLEITETALSGDEERVRVVLGQLHEIGVQISIDDYGSGYSSLHQVGTLGAQELKLDREFVTGVGERGDLRSILAATVHLAHGLRLRMVAEGVESASDLDQVRLSGCDLAQGFYISPPRSGESVVEWLAERADRVGDDRLRF